MKFKRQIARVLGVLTWLVMPLMASAQMASSKPITIVAPFVAGSPTDVLARAYAQELGTALGIPVIVDNKPGANQAIGASYVWRAPADGTTLLFLIVPAIVPPSMGKLPYQSLNEFRVVSDVLRISYMLAAAPDFPASNLKEFVSRLKASPGKYSYGSSGLATALHLVGEMFNQETGVTALHVPYKGANQIQMDLMSNRIDYAFLPMGALDAVKMGKLKSFGYASAKRDANSPDVPTMGESGLRFQPSASYFLLAPSGTPSAVVNQINAASNRILAGDTFYRKIQSIGGVQVSAPNTSQEAATKMATEIGRWDRLVKDANIKLE